MEQIVKNVTVARCIGSCPFNNGFDHDENNFPAWVSCYHPKAPDKVQANENIARFGAIPEECPLRDPSNREIVTRYQLRFA
jgi:hypothetical protein